MYTGKLSKIPCVALVNEEDAPFFDGGGSVGYFYLDPTEALLSLQLLKRRHPEVRRTISSPRGPPPVLRVHAS